MTPVAGWREVDATAPKPVLPCRCGSLNWGWFKPERRWICADCGTYPRGVAGADSVRCRAAPSLDAGQGVQISYAIKSLHERPYLFNAPLPRSNGKSA